MVGYKQIAKQPLKQHEERLMVFMFWHNKKQILLDSLLAHVVFFEAATQRHEHWIDETIDPEIEQLHLEIIGLIRQTLEKYKALIHKYNSYFT